MTAKDKGCSQSNGPKVRGQREGTRYPRTISIDRQTLELTTDSMAECTRGLMSSSLFSFFFPPSRSKFCCRNCLREDGRCEVLGFFGSDQVLLSSFLFSFSFSSFFRLLFFGSVFASFFLVQKRRSFCVFSCTLCGLSLNLIFLHSCSFQSKEWGSTLLSAECF